MPKRKRGKGKKAGKPAAGGQAPPAPGEETPPTPPTGALARIGRPTKLTPEVQRAMCERIEAGVSFDTAAELVGVGSDTVREWIARGLGRDKDRPPAPQFAGFAVAIARARAKDEARRIALITAAGEPSLLETVRETVDKNGKVTRITERRQIPGDWRAHAWILERRDPERWGPVNVAPPTPPSSLGGFDLRTILEAPAAATGGSMPKTRINVTPIEPHDPRPMKPKP